MVDQSSPKDIDWILDGQLQGIPLHFSGTHEGIKRSVARFLEALAGDPSVEPRQPLEFTLHLLENPSKQAFLQTTFTGENALIQFTNVSSVWEGDRLLFYTRDGSYIKSDIPRGQAWGFLSHELLDKKTYVLTDLLMAPFLEMLKHRGFFGLHAAALTRGGIGYLFPGDTQSGKTTVAVSLAREGFQYLADDKVILKEASNGIAALAFTRRFNISPDIGEYFQELRFLDTLSPLPGSTKRPYDISKTYPNAFALTCRPHFLIHLELTSGPTSWILPLSPKESFRRLARQTILSSQKEAASRQLKLLSKLAQTTGSYLLCGGNDIYGRPDRVLQLLPGIGSSS